ncbi:MAG: hypothetical protein QNJ49_04595 [Mastigocoleus sp. MO_167.B18]|uniref:hypothetical protein n=1 Tax=Mastigocoleus sp. MO_188.B34 TaxID=3036635 RepID=UPI00261355E2|nr:hypothetical protein [Mastigocoleus sp. MO_188.B34]MDJ0697860.1 hypothetical protein [Mastigocoleus sp. MO_188.B34]MDJ0772698.1 hypothetical protein [Mastigocoleus sp. MO_167.B18]
MVQFTSNVHHTEIAVSSDIAKELNKGLQLVGLNFSNSELHELQTQQIISIEDKSLSEIGSVFILAAAISSVNLGNPRHKFTFRDLLQEVDNSRCSSGIPIYSWEDESLIKKCLYLTVVKEKPVIILTSEEN